MQEVLIQENDNHNTCRFCEKKYHPDQWKSFIRHERGCSWPGLVLTKNILIYFVVVLIVLILISWYWPNSYIGRCWVNLNSDIFAINPTKDLECTTAFVELVLKSTGPVVSRAVMERDG